MIPFTPKRVSEPTFVFFCGRQRTRLKEVLDEDLVTGWGMYPLREAEEKLPADIKVPVVYTRPDATEEDGTPCSKNGIWVFVSYYDARDMKNFMITVFNHPETIAKHAAVSRAYFHEKTLEDLREKDPSPWEKD